MARRTPRERLVQLKVPWPQEELDGKIAANLLDRAHEKHVGTLSAGTGTSHRLSSLTSQHWGRYLPVGFVPHDRRASARAYKSRSFRVMRAPAVAEPFGCPVRFPAYALQRSVAAYVNSLASLCRPQSRPFAGLSGSLSGKHGAETFYQNVDLH